MNPTIQWHWGGGNSMGQIPDHCRGLGEVAISANLSHRIDRASPPTILWAIRPIAMVGAPLFHSRAMASWVPLE